MEGSCCSGKEATMDSLKIKGAQDRSKINMHEPHELQYWTKHLKVSKAQLEKAVNRVGNAAAAVRKELAASAVTRPPAPNS